MKRILGILIAVMMVVTLTATFVGADQEISVKLNGEKIDFADVKPQIINSRTMVPLRAIFEALGASVEWDDATKTVKSAKGDITIELTIGAKELKKNGTAVALDVPGQIVDSRTMVPVRAISEAYECEVNWDDATKTVLITTPAEEKADDGSIIVANAEDGEMHGLWTADGTKLEIVDDPIKSGNKVYAIIPTRTNGSIWAYVWVNAEFEAGKSYKLSFDALLGTDVFGNNIEKTRIDSNFAYSEDGAALKDHPAGGVVASMTEWTHLEKVVTIKPEYQPLKGTKFGIYGDPLKLDNYDFRVGVCYYIDNLSIVPTDAPAATEENKEEVKEEKKDVPALDVSGLKTVYELKYDNAETFGVGNVANASFDGGKLTGVSETRDPTITTKKAVDVNIDNVVAIKINAKIPEGAKSEIFFTTDGDGMLNEAKKYNTVSASGELTSHIVDMRTNEAWKGTLKLFRFDPVVAPEMAFEIVSVEFLAAE